MAYTYTKEDLLMKKLTIINENELSVNNNEKEIRININFPHINLGYSEKIAPTLKEILDNQFVKQEYQKAFAETEIGVIRIEVQSEIEGKEYFYDVEDKVWYFSKNINSLKEDEERLAFIAKNNKNEESFYKIQKQKCYSVAIVLFLTLMLYLFDLNNAFSSFFLRFGCLYAVIMCLNLTFSKIRFERTGA